MCHPTYGMLLQRRGPAAAAALQDGGGRGDRDYLHTVFLVAFGNRRNHSVDRKDGTLAVDVAAFDGLNVRGKAVLIATGWDRHWGSDQYYHDHSFLTEAAAHRLVSEGVALVGIDSHNIDNTRVRTRPVHTALLAAGIPICEHMTGLGALPDSGFRFSAVPPKVKGMGTFAVRAHALVES